MHAKTPLIVCVGADYRTAARFMRFLHAICSSTRFTCAVHLVAGPTTSSFFPRIARTILARPLVTTSVERFSCQKLVKTCMYSHPGILEKKINGIRPPLNRLACSHAVANQPTARCNKKQIREKTHTRGRVQPPPPTQRSIASSEGHHSGPPCDHQRHQGGGAGAPSYAP